MTFADLRLPCPEHGLYDKHYKEPADVEAWKRHETVCEGRSATIEDLDGRKVGFCETHGSLQKNPHEKKHCEFAIGARSNRYLAACCLVQSVLIPSGVTAEEET